MAGVKFDDVLEQVKALSREEQQELRVLLDDLVKVPPSGAAEDELERQLLKAGLLSEIKPLITDLTPYQSRKPADGTGRPLSEVIIEERR